MIQFSEKVKPEGSILPVNSLFKFPLSKLSGHWRWNGETSWAYGRNKKMAIQWQRVFGCGFFQGDSDAFYKLWFITLPTLSWVVGKTNCSRLENGAGKLQLSATHMKETAMPPWQNEKNHLTISIGFLVWDIFERVSHPQKWLKPDKEYLKRNLECKSRIFCTSYNLIIWLISSFKKGSYFPKDISNMTFDCVWIR